MSLKAIDTQKKYVNETLTVAAGGYEVVPVGNYQATFLGLEETETKNGPCWRWCFQIDGDEHDGKHITELSDTNPTCKNKAGRFLVALGKKKLEAGVSVNPGDYVGERYLLIVEQKDSERTKITTFSKLG